MRLALTMGISFQEVTRWRKMLQEAQIKADGGGLRLEPAIKTAQFTWQIEKHTI